ncbi:unnamed protein product [Ostreobium quekettii]|uniref:Uncharacterized protein n=1 Tax=Ostreobium quekettii TaxID=121088 RepID=A0A8S1J0I2_9CHLO|nr:unnamed protein product [Ostreobium quekettii]
MASADGPDGALDEMLDDALRDLEADAAPQPPPAPEDGGPSAAKTSRQSAGTSTSGEPSGLTFDPMKRPRPKRAAPRGAGGARGEKLEDAREVYAGLMSLVQGMDTRRYWKVDGVGGVSMRLRLWEHGEHCQGGDDLGGRRAARLLCWLR